MGEDSWTVRHGLGTAFAPMLLALEPRLMFDGAAGAELVETLADAEPPPPPPPAEPAANNDRTPQDDQAAPEDDGNPDPGDGEAVADGEDDGPAASIEAGSRPTHLVFIDAAVRDPQVLIDGLGEDAEVIMLEVGRDGVKQMSEALAGRHDVDSIHVISHGSPGSLSLGTATLSADSLDRYVMELDAIGFALKETGDLLLYGCDVAQGSAGAAFLDAIAARTGADIAASDDATGAAALGGDWELEVERGEVESVIPSSNFQWSGLLADSEKLGDPFLANTSTASYQNSPTTAALTNGNFLTVWDDNSAGHHDIRGQLLDRIGTKIGNEILINTTTSNHQLAPAAAALDDGEFVVVWTDEGQSSGDIIGQVFNADGTPKGSEFRANTTTAGVQGGPAVIGLSSGGFVATWQDDSASPDDSSGQAIRAQIFDSAGSPQGSEFLVNTTTPNAQVRPAGAALSEGRFVLIWQDHSLLAGDAEGAAVVGQIFNADGSKSGSEFLVNSTTVNDQLDPSVAALTDGKFVVTWRDDSLSADDPSGTAVRGQLFDDGGTKQGGEFLINTTTDDVQDTPSVSALREGRFVVAWSDFSQSGGDTSGHAVRAQIFDGSGLMLGNELLANTNTANLQAHPSVSTLVDGRFVVVWEDWSQAGADTDQSAIGGQIFSAPVIASFQEQQTITSDGGNTSAIFAADLDGDGDQDILGAAYDDGQINWYENDGSGNFVKKTIADGINGARFVNAADIDLDGDLDVLSTAYVDDQVAWHENLGNGVFGSPRVITTNADGVISVFAGDLDGDGDMDVLSASQVDNRVAWYENLGGGNFGQQRTIVQNSSSQEIVLAVDLDKDGDLDVLWCGDGSTDRIVWHENLGDGTISEQGHVIEANIDTFFIEVADIDLDGQLDILGVSRGDNSVYWYRNLGGGEFSSRNIISGQLGEPRCVRVADLDSDGDLDVISTSFGADTVAWHENLGGGRFGPKNAITVNADGANAVVAADIDGDGDKDLVASSINDDRIFWHKNAVAGIRVMGDGLTVDEGGTADFAVVLNSRPTDDVIISISTSSSEEGSSSVSTLTFSPTNWDIAQTVTVQGTKDDTNDGPNSFSILLDPVASNDTIYNELNVAGIVIASKDVDLGPPEVDSVSILEETDTGAIAITRNAADGDEVSHYKITNITGGRLYSDSGFTNEITVASFIASAGATTDVYFRPTPDFHGTASFDVQASLSAGDAGLGGSPTTATITVGAVADTPAVEDAAIAEDQDTGAIAITRNPADGGEISHYKITNITGGRLYSDSGFTNEITAGSFIASAGATTDVYFRPTANFHGTGGFDVRASTSDADGGLSGGTVRSTITVGAVADTPSVSNATIAEDGGAVAVDITRAAADGGEINHYRISGISAGTLFRDQTLRDAIPNGGFVEAAGALTRVYFRPDPDFHGQAGFSVEAATVPAASGVAGAAVRSAVTVTPVGDAPQAGSLSAVRGSLSSDRVEITRNAVDGEEITHFRVSGISGGRVFLADGTTRVADGGFITAAEGAGGLRFAPALGASGDGSFVVTAATGQSPSAAAGAGTRVTIDVTPAPVTPVNPSPNGGDDGPANGSGGSDRDGQAGSELSLSTNVARGNGGSIDFVDLGLPSFTGLSASADGVTEETASDQSAAALVRALASGSNTPGEMIRSMAETLAQQSLEFREALREQFRTMPVGTLIDDLEASGLPQSDVVASLLRWVADGGQVNQREFREYLAAREVDRDTAMGYLMVYERVAREARNQLFSQAIDQLESGVEPVPAVVTAIPGETEMVADVFGHDRVAIIISIDNYQDPNIPTLETPEADARALADVMERQLGFKTAHLHDPTKAQIFELLTQAVNGLAPERDLVIYFAGHGVLLPANDTGYWLPADARIDRADAWISTNEIAAILNTVPSRHVLLISDSCYSGTLTREQQVGKEILTASFDEVEDRRSITVMSSGGEEPVLDDGGDGHSVFARQLLDRLAEVRDEDFGFEIFETVHREVVAVAPQVPQYGAIMSAGHEAGSDYVFAPAGT